MFTCLVTATYNVIGSHSVETIYSGKPQFSNVMGSQFIVIMTCARSRLDNVSKIFTRSYHKDLYKIMQGPLGSDFIWIFKTSGTSTRPWPKSSQETSIFSRASSRTLRGSLARGLRCHIFSTRTLWGKSRPKWAQ